MRSFRSYNERVCFAAMEEFTRLGVEDVFIAPGSRSTPLVIAAEENTKLKKHVHFDERGLGFFALGASLKSKKPVVVITTSGTAAANLYPAVIEASLCHVPLILCTADRPFELRDTGANQAIDQVRMFGMGVQAYDIPAPHQNLPLESILSTLDCAVTTALSDGGGPVQLNWMFQEPLVPPADGKIPQWEKHVQTWFDSGQSLVRQSSVKTESLVSDEVRTLIANAKNGVVIIAGRGDETPSTETLNKLKWPLFCDIQNSSRLKETNTQIPFWDLILEGRELKPDCVVWFGGAMTNKRGLEFFKNLGCPIVHVQGSSERLDPHHLSKYQIVGSTQRVWNLLSEAKPSESLEGLKKANDSISKFLDKELSTPDKDVTEPGLVHTLLKNVKSGNLFLGSSRPIRDFQRFAKTSKGDINIFCNRGASGIDGTVATATGVAAASKEEELTVGVWGDLAVLHDLNSLKLVKSSRSPILMLVVNNNGGGIFSFLPISQHKDIFDKYWGTPHDLDFKNFAAGFGLPYATVSKNDELAQVLADYDQKSHLLIEIKTQREGNWVYHQWINQQVKSLLS